MSCTRVKMCEWSIINQHLKTNKRRQSLAKVRGRGKKGRTIVVVRDKPSGACCTCRDPVFREVTPLVFALLAPLPESRQSYYTGPTQTTDASTQTSLRMCQRGIYLRLQEREMKNVAGNRRDSVTSPLPPTTEKVVKSLTKTTTQGACNVAHLLKRGAHSTSDTYKLQLHPATTKRCPVTYPGWHVHTTNKLQADLSRAFLVEQSSRQEVPLPPSCLEPEVTRGADCSS